MHISEKRDIIFTVCRLQDISDHKKGDFRVSFFMDIGAQDLNLREEV